jgi:hypothetical protein
MIWRRLGGRCTKRLVPNVDGVVAVGQPASGAINYDGSAQFSRELMSRMGGAAKAVET